MSRPIIRTVVVPLSQGMQVVADVAESNAREGYIPMVATYIPTTDKGAMMMMFVDHDPEEEIDTEATLRVLDVPSNNNNDNDTDPDPEPNAG